VAATVPRRFPDEPPGFVVRSAAPVDGIGWASPVVLAACASYGYRARPAFCSWSPLPLYTNSGRTTLARQQNGGIEPDFVTAVASGNTFTYEDSRFRFRTSAWARYLWVAVLCDAEIGPSSDVVASVRTPNINGVAGGVVDNGCTMIAPVVSNLLGTPWWAAGAPQWSTTGTVADDTSVLASAPRLLNLDATGAPNSGVDTDVEVVIDYDGGTGDIRVRGVSIWELWEASVA